MANELGRLAQGIGEQMPTGSDTFHFITNYAVPKYMFVTYARILCDILPQKAEIHSTRLTVGGNLIKYPHSDIPLTSDISTVKFLLNSVISTPNANFCGGDIKYFYLNTPMDTFEYM